MEATLICFLPLHVLFDYFRYMITSNMQGRVVLITGANTGLGLEIVRSLCRVPGSNTIILGGRSVEKVAAAITRIQKEQPASSSTLEALQIDVEDDSSILTAAERVEQDFGRLDVLVNNAGLYMT